MRKIPFAGIELTSQRVRGYMVPLSYLVGHFGGKHAKGAKETEMFHFFVGRSVFFFVATYGNETGPT